MSSSTSVEEVTPPWESLPREITAAILRKLTDVEILNSARFVCPTWRSVSEDPYMWRCIDMEYSGVIFPYYTEDLCRLAVDLSQGQLINISISGFGNDDLLLYISQRCPQLKSIQLKLNCGLLTGEGLIEAVNKLPLLEELHLHLCSINAKCIETIGRCCPLLKSFKSSNHWYNVPPQLVSCDLIALAIAKNMPGLRHLQLIGDRISYEGLQHVLQGCPNLESLDLRMCFNLRLSGDLTKLRSERIKILKLPNDSMDDYHFGAVNYDDYMLNDCYEEPVDIDVYDDRYFSD